MSVSALTRRYAKALVEIAVEEKAVVAYGDELTTVKDVLLQEELLRQLLDSPMRHPRAECLVGHLGEGGLIRRVLDHPVEFRLLPANSAE